MRANLLLSSALVATAFVVGCEWTSSDGITWDDNYNNVNFSGTYPIGTIVADAEEAEAGPTEIEQRDSRTFSSNVGQLLSPVVPGSVSITGKFTDGRPFTASDNGDGTLGGSQGGTISYEGGSVHVAAGDNPDFGSIKSMTVTYKYTSQQPATTKKGQTITSITVHQTGQNVTFTLSNGWTYSGRISGFDYNADSVEASSQVIAKYNVSGSHGSIVGTLTSGTSIRSIDGVMDGASFTGSISGAGRSVSSSAATAEE